MTGQLLLLLLLFHSLLYVQLEKTAVPKLSQYNVEKDKISISGFGSGAYFSVQFHVSFSKTIMGAGIATGGPYWCAENIGLRVYTSCTIDPANISVPVLVNATNTFASKGAIDPPENLNTSKVFLFAGTLDSMVYPGVVKKTEEYYRNFVPSDNIATEYSIPSEHAIVTDVWGNVCTALTYVYINKCNYPTATRILQHIYHDVKSPTLEENVKEDNLIEFDQTEFFNETLNLASMDSSGFIYVPTACMNGNKTCRLHIAFHGCGQGERDYTGYTLFVLYAGYNGVAEANDIIVLYPQVVKNPDNPFGCWDWFGYTGSEYAFKQGAQMAGIKLMLNRVAGLS